MIELSVTAASHNYRISIDAGIRHKLAELLDPSIEKLVIVTDEHVQKYYLDDCLHALNSSFPTDVYVIPPGEQSKSLEEYKSLQQFLLRQRMTRKSAILALGGGVVGDLAGFAAATYARGIGFIQMPSTILAHDSSIGGKVAVNLDGKKNIIGSFYPPHQVIFDLDMFQTLNDQEIRSGLAEMVKHGLIADRRLYDDLLTFTRMGMDLSSSDFKHLLVRSIQVKNNIVQLDEKETNIRQFLNFGHSFGHALEAVRMNERTHGECVMLGMIFALWVSNEKFNHLNDLSIQELIHWVKKMDYPLNLDNVTSEEILNLMKFDKKNTRDDFQFVLLEQVGKPYLQKIDVNTMENYLNEFMTKWNQGEFNWLK
ncbi:3-dehydroquinate synthase [Allobacillus halotolerans]|uniref:3-dehydroquinate synthase n=1 Tax=Allobacillus halotolerans TaxID=570278 RepID=A0ABS6GJW2_9BACI|nr:3-dehydroquinate synthase [Allobacillus halotolerans]MBU6079512.1 3-dehydroquinate synthase [Allobacillus halotolerans]